MHRYCQQCHEGFVDTERPSGDTARDEMREDSDSLKIVRK